MFTYFGFIIRQISLTVCRTHTFFTISFTHMSSFILASVSVERAIATNFINFAKDYCKPRVAYRILALNFLLASIINFHYLCFLGYDEESDKMLLNDANNYDNYSSSIIFHCGSKPDTLYDRYFDPYNQWLDLLFYAFLPFIIMTVCTFFIIRVLFITNKRFKNHLSGRRNATIKTTTSSLLNNLNNTASGTSRPNRSFDASACVINAVDARKESYTVMLDEVCNIDNSKDVRRFSTVYFKKKLFERRLSPTSARLSKTLHLTYTLISINALFFCLVSPLILVMIFVNDIKNNQILFNVVYLLAYSNHSFNFIFYGLSSPPYREAFKGIFMSFKSKKKKNINYNGQSAKHLISIAKRQTIANL
jgi:hypothetical protein